MNDFKNDFENAFSEEFKGKIKNPFGDFFNNIDSKMKGSFRNAQKKSSIVLAILFVLIYYFIMLPPLNIRSRESWIFVMAILAIFVIIGGKSYKSYKVLRRILIGALLLFGIMQVPGMPFFAARSYSNLITITDSDFKKDISELSIDKIPTLDRDSTVKLGSRKMGELIDLVSQFDIDEATYTQINYKDHPVRVTPLKYDGLIKYIFNMSKGLPGYLRVDIVNGEAELQRLDKGIKISKEDYLFRDITRYARLRYPFDIFGKINFEIDDQGTPFWVIPTYSPKIFMFDGLDVNGAILVNASTGEHKKYPVNEIPQWIDRVYDSDNIIQQLDWHGMYQKGYINSVLAQQNVMLTTEGYNYLALNDDVYLYTGFTSTAADESNVGFILSNLRTKETKFYPVSSAKEYSAMASAEGAVQEKGYQATFPLLLNVKGQPTYFLSLKDNSGLIKSYAFIDAKNYQRVSIGNSVPVAMKNHLESMMGYSKDDENADQAQVKILDKKGIVSDVKSVVINGNTHYYLLLEGDDKVYVTNISLSDKLPFVEKGSSITFKYKEAIVNEIVEVSEIK